MKIYVDLNRAKLILQSKRSTITWLPWGPEKVPKALDMLTLHAAIGATLDGGFGWEILRFGRSWKPKTARSNGSSKGPWMWHCKAASIDLFFLFFCSTPLDLNWMPIESCPDFFFGSLKHYILMWCITIVGIYLLNSHAHTFVCKSNSVQAHACAPPEGLSVDA